jgi:hypothetical protein
MNDSEQNESYFLLPIYDLVMFL